MDKPSCLITGATGFVGSNLAAELKQRGWQVCCLVRSTSRSDELKRLGVELQVGELADCQSLKSAIAKVDVVFHLAGRIRALHDGQFEQDNVEGTRNVAEACAAAAQPPVLVFMSSLAAGGPGTDTAPRLETDEDRPVSAYGRSKLGAEQAAATFASTVPLSIVRPPMVLGQADRISLQLFRFVRIWHLHLVPGFRRFPLSVIHVADLCDAVVRIAQQGQRVTVTDNGKVDLASGTYHAAAERVISYGELGRLAAAGLKVSVLVIRVPKLLFWLVGATAELVGKIRRQPAMLNLDKIREAVAPGWVCSDERIRNELGYRPAEPIEQRFAETADWYREQGWL